MGIVVPDGRILLIIGGGIAAYKCLELIRRGRERGLAFRCVMTAAATQFVTPLSVASLAGDKVYQDLFSLTDEAEMGHIRLSREADLVVVAPATADLMAKMAAGLADDLASTLLLATDKPVLIAPAMNPQMWGHPATRRNVARLRRGRGAAWSGPNPGDMACGEVGAGRMAEPHEILTRSSWLLAPRRRAAGRPRALVTSGPTREPIDPGPLSRPTTPPAGRATPSPRALAEAGAEVTLVSGPVAEPRPAGRHESVTSKRRARCWRRSKPRCRPTSRSSPPPWPTGGRPRCRPTRSRSARAAAAHDRAGRKPGHSRGPWPRHATGARAGDRLCRRDRGPGGARPAPSSRARDATGSSPTTSRPARGVFGGDRNRILLLTGDGRREAWPEMDKLAVARRLVAADRPSGSAQDLTDG